VILHQNEVMKLQGFYNNSLKFLFGLVFIIISSCGNTDDIIQINQDQIYKQTKVNSIKVFKVDSILFPGSLEDTVFKTVYIKEKIMSLENDSGDNISLLKEEFVSNEYPSGNWKFLQFVSYTFDDYQSIQKRDNEKKMFMIFPIAKSKSWNENLFNTKTPFFLRYDEIGDIFMIDNRNFINTISVIPDKIIDDIVESVNAKMVYAPAFGLIFEKRENIQKQKKKGFIYEKKMVDYYNF